jgi:hypothetical protein
MSRTLCRLEYRQVMSVSKISVFGAHLLRSTKKDGHRLAISPKTRSTIKVSKLELHKVASTDPYARVYGFVTFPLPAFTHRYRVAFEILRVLQISGMESVRSR